MKKIITLSILAITIYSCQITERLYLQESGAVKYETELNFTEMMAFVYDENTKDSLRRIGEYPLDTLINFTELQNFGQAGADSISAAQMDFMRALNKTKVHMLMNDDEGRIIVRVEEKNIESLNQYLKLVNDAYKKLELEDPAAAAEVGQSGIMKPLQLNFDGRKFQRIAMEQNNFLNELDDSTAEATRQMMNMFQYKLEYHFPKRVKSSTMENATFSMDGKTMTVDVPMSDFWENPEKYNFTVELE